jgi:hypothetical protein
MEEGCCCLGPDVAVAAHGWCSSLRTRSSPFSGRRHRRVAATGGVTRRRTSSRSSRVLRGRGDWGRREGAGRSRGGEAAGWCGRGGKVAGGKEPAAGEERRSRTRGERGLRDWDFVSKVPHLAPKLPPHILARNSNFPEISRSSRIVSSFPLDPSIQSTSTTAQVYPD